MAQKENLSSPSFHTRPGIRRSQAHQHQADAQHPVDAEQGSVGVNRRRVQALHVVEGDRRVNHEAEQPGPDHVPEGHGDEEVDRPLVLAHPGRRLRHAAGLPAPGKPTRISGTTSRALNTDPQARATVGVPEKYRWWQRADDAAGQEDRGREQGTPPQPADGVTRFSRKKKKAMTVVAKTSKNPSTHR